MSITSLRRAPLGMILHFLAFAGLSAYFTFAAVQGSYGLAARAEIEAETARHAEQLAGLTVEIARMEELTHRLSDSYLDLDLLDQQARDILGMLRSDELVIR